MGFEVQAVLVISAVVILFFCVWPGMVVGAADAAAIVLFAG
jgi:hypothetical protein